MNNSLSIILSAAEDVACELKYEYLDEEMDEEIS
jgi:hypothetical protein